MEAKQLLYRMVKMRQGETGINIAVSCFVLFDMKDEQECLEKEGLEAFQNMQRAKEKEMLKPGTAFPFVKVLDHVNKQLMSLDDQEQELFDVILTSPDSTSTSLRLVNSIEHNGLSTQRLCLTDGQGPVQYLEAYKIKLFLSSFDEEVIEASKTGIAAAKLTSQDVMPPPEDHLRLAFDLDSVIFDDESEGILKGKGLVDYIKHERGMALQINGGGPIKHFAEIIGRMQKKFKAQSDKFPTCPIRTYVVTARGVLVAERALRSLKEWDLDLNEAHFTALAPKGGILESIRPHLFFDDQLKHAESARQVGVPAAHVIRPLD